MPTGRHDGHAHVTAVIFDYGEVLCYRPPADEFQRMAKIFGLSLESFLARWEGSRALLDRGDLTPDAYWARFARESQTTITAEQTETLCRWEIEMWSNPNPIMVDWLLQLSSAGTKTALLSNMPADLAAHLQKNFAWMSTFDFKTFSSYVNLLKPDPAIYEYTLRSLGVRPSEALFVDDRQPNIEAARKLGMQAIQFQSTTKLRNDLKGLDFPILPESSNAGRGGS
jgi:putative hydrolase of the HAD superfamily